jgi:hypothetical protein
MTELYIRSLWRAIARVGVKEWICGVDVGNTLSAETILEHAKAFQRIVCICENYDKAVASSHHSLGQSATASASALLAVTAAAMSEQQEEVQSTITRAEIYLKHATMTQAVVQSLTSVLYNRISQNDNSSMKTIAVVTLFFLPATFVSAIFSTGIFNFHAGEPSHAQNIVSSRQISPFVYKQ